MHRSRCPTLPPISPADKVFGVSLGRIEDVREQWKSRILVQKNMIATMQSAINKLNNSIHFANCAGNCVQWNRRQVKKQREVERLEAQLEDQKKGLEDMQESARRQGYGSSVYDP